MNTPSTPMQTHHIPGPGTFSFSAVRLDDLGATEYTLVTVVVDTTGSVQAFADELLDCVRRIVEACRRTPRSENLLLRLLTFNTELHEVHGFKPLSEIDPAAYKPFRPTGMTALFDAAYSGIGATLEMAKRLHAQGFEVNGCVYIVTDGMDNASTLTPKAIADRTSQAAAAEEIASLTTVLVGLIDPTESSAPEVRNALTTFEVDAGLSRFIDAGDATPRRLAALARFVSRSISSHSMALSAGGGAAPVPLTF